MTKVYNPLTLNTSKDKPTFMNEQGNFWLVEDSGDYKIYRFFRTCENIFGKFGDEMFLLTYKDNIIKDSKSFESLAVFKDLHKAGKLD